MDYVTDRKLYFKRFDVNDDGKLSASELLPALQSIGYNPTKTDINRILEAADDNGDGMIDYNSEEFDALLLELEDQPYGQVLEAFKHFDKDGNGYLDTEELRTILTTMGGSLTEEEVETRIKMADKNGDGRVDYSEFVEMNNFTAPLLH